MNSDLRSKDRSDLTIENFKNFHLIDRNPADFNVLMAFLSLDKILERLELSLLEDRNDRLKRFIKVTARSKKSRRRTNAPHRRRSHNQFKGLH